MLDGMRREHGLRIAALAVFCAAAAASGADRYPAFTDYVVDSARIVDADSTARIQQIASRLDHAGIAQIAVCTVSDLGDASKEEYAAGLFEKWGLGHGKQRADGLLVLLVPGKPGHRKIKVEVGQGLEGILPDGKVGALIDQYAVPAMTRDDYGTAAADLVQAFARVIEANAGEGGELAPAQRPQRAAGRSDPAVPGVAGLGIAVVAMVALLIIIASSGARRRFPGRKTAVAAVGLTGVTALVLVTLGSAAGLIALLLGIFANGLAYASIRSHRCPRDGSWLMIDEEIIDEPTYWSSGLARVVEACTNRSCGYRRQYDKELPRKQRTVYIGGGGGGWGGGGGGGWGGGGGGDGFGGGGGGDSGGGGAGRDV
jgi:uncharacterized protein